MKARLHLTLLVAVLLLSGISTAVAQTGSQAAQNDMSAQEFRQVLLDWGAYVDARTGTTNVRVRLEQAPLESFDEMLHVISNPRRLQQAVGVLTAAQANRVAKHLPTPRLNTRVAAPRDFLAGGGCVGILRDDSPFPACRPAYPSGPSWENLINALIPQTVKAPDAASAANQRCDSNEEAALSLSVSSFQGLVTSISAGCNIIPAPANAVCWAPVIAIATGAASAQGFFADCLEQDGDVNAAQIEAAYVNSVKTFDAMDQNFGSLGGQVNNVLTSVNGITTVVNTIPTQITALETDVDNRITAVDLDMAMKFSQLSTQISDADKLRLRISIEQDLAGSGAPVGLFVLPNSSGGYLDLARTIVSDTITKMAAAGQNVHNASAKLTQADSDIAAKKYKAAYLDLRGAYSAAVQ